MLYRSEFAKHRSLFSVLLAIFLFLLNIGITAWQYRIGFTDEGRQIAAAQEELIELYNTDREEYDRRTSDFDDRMSAYNVELQISLVRNGTMPVFENKYIDFPTYGDSQLFRDVKNVVNAPREYHDAVYALLRDASLRLYELENTDSYIYRYYIELISEYDPFAEAEFEAQRILGWNEFFSLETPLIFLVLASLALFCGTFTVEDRAGMTNLLRVSRRGGRPLTLAKLGYVGVTSVVLTIVFTLSPLVIFALSGGLSSLDAPIQLLDEFTYCRFDITVGQYLVVYTAVRVLIMLCFSLAVAVIGQYSASEMPAFVFTVVLAVAGILMDGISPQSAYYSLAKYSPTAVANVNILFTRYRGVNFFGACLDYTFVVVVVTAVLTAAAAALSLARGAKKSVRVMGEKKRSRDHRMSLSLFGAESYKIFVCEGGLPVILAAVLLKCVISGVYYQPTVGMDESTYAEYIAQVQGEVTDDKLAYIETEAEYIETILGQYSSIQKQYRDGEISSAEYNEYLSRYNYANFCERACERLCERRDYVVKMSETHENIQFLYEAGIEKYLTAPLDITAVLAAVFICGNVFASEYERGFSKILRLTKRGRAATFGRKILLTVLLSCGFYAVFSAVDLFYLFKNYTPANLDASILSIPTFAEVSAEMSILTYAVWYKIVGLLGYVVTCVLICALSVLLEAQLKSCIVAVLCVFIPFVTDYYGVPVFRFVSLAYFMSPADVTGGVLSYVCCTAAMVLVIVAAGRKWCGTTSRSRASRRYSRA